MPEPIEITEMKKNSENRDYVLKTVKENGKLLELLISGLKITGQILYYATMEMRDDKEVVKLAVENKPIILKYASNRLKSDKEIGIIAIKKDKSVFQFLGEELKVDEEILQIKNN